VNEAIKRLASKWGVEFKTSRADGSWSTSESLPRAEAKALAEALELAGVEASDAIDGHDRSRAWVHITVEEILS
jgi:hypothetical protein